jgi:hypothetical protein
VLKRNRHLGLPSSAFFLIGAPSRSRTGTSFRTTDFKSETKTLFFNRLGRFPFLNLLFSSSVQPFVFKGCK